jgi:hypothetical protein
VGQLTWVGSAVVQAAEATRGPLGGVQGPDLPFPSIGRLVFGFLVTAILALAVTFALKRWWPLLSKHRGTVAGGRIRTLEGATLSATLRVYVLEVEGAKYLVAEGRSGLSITRMQPGDDSSAQARS